MPYTKSIIVGIIIFALLVPVLGALPYKGTDNISSFKLVIPKFEPPITNDDIAYSGTAGPTYGTTIHTIVYTAANGTNTRDDFNGYGGINGTVKNRGDVLMYFGITDKAAYDLRYSKYANEEFSGNPTPLFELMKISRFVSLVPLESKDISLAFSNPPNDMVIRTLPSPYQSGEYEIEAEVNVRNYKNLFDYMTKFIFMLDTDVYNFTITVTSNTAGDFFIYIGITPLLKMNERETTYGNIQYRQFTSAIKAYSDLGLSYSSRSKLMTRTAYGNMPMVTKGYYLLRAVTFYTTDVEVSVDISNTRPGASFFVRFRILLVALIALYRPFRIRRDIEYLLKK